MSLSVAIVSPTRANFSLHIQADLTWTVAQLKQAICDVHQEHPAPATQRLVHQGRLLNDSHNIMDVLNADAHGNVLVHLVLSRGAPASAPLAPPVVPVAVVVVPGHVAQAAPMVAPPAAPVGMPRANNNDDDDGEENENRPRGWWAWFQLVAKLALFVALIGHGLSATRLAILSLAAVLLFLIQHGFLFARRAQPIRGVAPAAAARAPAAQDAAAAAAPAPTSVFGALMTVTGRLITSLIPSEHDGDP